ncbi:MAG: 16S rRNA (uracil(1498)-N(3))-methyltransferase [Gammaproteobacteria bacterium]|nr:MAG: 16S rRNA (uracil(1498)-N(3))-methyltransferase [Gammaproteobacteria bacterium]
MRTIRLYCPELNSDLDEFTLPSAIHRHAVQVLRLKKGNRVQLFDGKGLEYNAEFIEVGKRESRVELKEKLQINVESPLDVTLLQGISRGERMDYALQKAVELGVNRIIPVETERCNVQLSSGRADKRLAHWQGVIVSACEQSGRSVLPSLTTIMSLEQALKASDASCRLILDPEATSGFTTIEKHDSIALLIGPEGGLSEQEINNAEQAEFQPVRFGPRILRTETATAAALAVIQTLWGDLG